MNANTSSNSFSNTNTNTNTTADTDSDTTASATFGQGLGNKFFSVVASGATGWLSHWKADVTTGSAMKTK